MIVATPEVPGIDKVSGNAVDYLMLVKTKPGAQFAVRRELQRRIKASFEKNHIEPGDPSRVIVAGIAKAKLAISGGFPTSSIHPVPPISPEAGWWLRNRDRPIPLRSTIRRFRPRSPGPAV